MKKLHKKLEKVAEHIDYTHANQLRLLKELSIACQHYELAAHLREYQRHAEKSLAESSKFIKPESEFTPLEQLLERNGWKLTEDVLTSIEKRLEYVLDSKVSNTESLNTRVNRLIDKLQSTSNSPLSAADINQIGEWFSSGGKSGSLMTILGDDSDGNKAIDRGLAIIAEILKQGMKLKEAQEDTTLFPLP